MRSRSERRATFVPLWAAASGGQRWPAESNGWVLSRPNTREASLGHHPSHLFCQDDPSGDLVASVLLLAMSRSGRTAEVLSELAVTIRDRASMRLRVDAERAGQHGEARFVVGFGAVVITAVIVFGQNTTFLDAYDSAAGQLVAGRRRPAAAYPAPARAAEVTIVGPRLPAGDRRGAGRGHGALHQHPHVGAHGDRGYADGGR